MNKREIVGTNPMNFLLDVQSAVLEGWRVDEDSPFSLSWSGLYSVWLKKEEEVKKKPASKGAL